MKIFLLLLLITIIPNFYKAQKITIVDKNNKAIVNVKAIGSDGKILGLSDFNGIINLSNKESTEVELFHPDYNSALYNISMKQDSITLKNLNFKDIDEIIINKNKKYLKLYAFFSSYQIINDNPQSYNDGIIMYTLNAKTFKIKKSTIIKQRTLKNIEFINEFYKEYSPKTFSLGSNIAPLSFHEELLNSNSISLKNNTITFIKGIGKKEILPNLNINIIYISPSQTKKQSLFGIKSEIFNYTISQSFNNSEYKLDELKSISKYYKSKITQNNKSYDYELIQNIYIIKPEFADDEINIEKNVDFGSIIPETIKSLIKGKKLK